MQDELQKWESVLNQTSFFKEILNELAWAIVKGLRYLCDSM